jgi:hypothetical protein
MVRNSHHVMNTCVAGVEVIARVLATLSESVENQTSRKLFPFVLIVLNRPEWFPFEVIESAKLFPK